MATQYDEMWSKLGLDLAGHDQLLQVLGQGYQDVFLSQANRPQGMEYFNFVMSEVHGLRVKELVDGQAQGHKVVGSFCVFVPEEIVRAADATLVGLCTGADFAPEEVDKILPRNTCALIKSAFGFKLGKVCPFLEASDMIVGENTCDGKKKSYETLDGLVPNLYVMDIPQVKSEQGRQLLKTEFLRFMKAIEELTGNKLDVDSLKKGIKIVNEKRGALQRMYKLRKANPAPISGLDALLMSQVQFYDDPIRFTENVNSICDEMEKRIADGVGAVNADAPRVLLAGLPHGRAQLEGAPHHRTGRARLSWARNPALVSAVCATWWMTAPTASRDWWRPLSTATSRSTAPCSPPTRTGWSTSSRWPPTTTPRASFNTAYSSVSPTRWKPLGWNKISRKAACR